MFTTLTFHIPFPIHKMPNRHVEATVNTDWPTVHPDGPPKVMSLQTAATFDIVEHDGAPLLRAAGWAVHKTGSPTATYSAEAHGALSITRVGLRVPAIVPIRMGEQRWLFEKLTHLVNGFLDIHTAHTMTLWTPRATPRDIIDLSWAHSGPDGAREGRILSFGNDAPVRAGLGPLVLGPAPLYGDLARHYNKPWAATVLDGLREVLALRNARGASLAALGFELFVNEVLSSSPRAAAAERQSLSAKVVSLLAPLVGGSLSSARAHGSQVAADWDLILHGRNSLLHRMAPRFTWTIGGVQRSADVEDLRGCVDYFRAVLAVRRHIERRLAGRGGEGG